MHRRHLSIIPIWLIIMLSATAISAQAAAPKWFTVSGGVLTIQPNNTTANVAGVGDSLTVTAAAGALILKCLIFNGGTTTQNGAGVAGTDSLTVFGQIGGLFAAKPCSVGGLVGPGCTAGFTTTSTSSPAAFTSTLPFPTQLGQLGTANIDTITNPSFLVTFGGSCAVGGTTEAFSAPSLQAFLSNSAGSPANASKECTGTAPATLQASITPFPKTQLGSGTLNGTQGTAATLTTALGGTIELWRVPAAVSLTSANQVCTALAVLLTTA